MTFSLGSKHGFSLFVQTVGKGQELHFGFNSSDISLALDLHTPGIASVNEWVGNMIGEGPTTLGFWGLMWQNKIPYFLVFFKVFEYFVIATLNLFIFKN